MNSLMIATFSGFVGVFALLLVAKAFRSVRSRSRYNREGQGF